MNKILTIVIPTYNMEKYLRRCLDSLIINDKELFETLQVLVVNDGSKDNSSAIAHEYQERYPDVFVVIDKDNGHYGSCINAALKIASGKYFRILDADDWFNNDALISLVSKLAVIEVEAVYTPYDIFYEKNGVIERQPKPDNIEWGKVYSLDDIKLSIPFLHMHCLIYKTCLLKKIAYKQTEGVCYTDTEYVYKPLSASKDIICINEGLYQYYVGRDDQSTSKSIQFKNFNHFLLVLKVLINYKSEIENNNSKFLREFYIDVLFGYLIPIHLEYSYSDKAQEISLRNVINEIEIRNESLSFLENLSEMGYHYGLSWYYMRCPILDKIFWKIVRAKNEMIDILINIKRRLMT